MSAILRRTYLSLGLSALAPLYIYAFYISKYLASSSASQRSLSFLDSDKYALTSASDSIFGVFGFSGIFLRIPHSESHFEGVMALSYIPEGRGNPVTGAAPSHIRAQSPTTVRSMCSISRALFFLILFRTSIDRSASEQPRQTLLSTLAAPILREQHP